MNFVILTSSACVFTACSSLQCSSRKNIPCSMRSLMHIFDDVMLGITDQKTLAIISNNQQKPFEHIMSPMHSIHATHPSKSKLLYITETFDVYESFIDVVNDISLPVYICTLTKKFKFDAIVDIVVKDTLMFIVYVYQNKTFYTTYTLDLQVRIQEPHLVYEDCIDNAIFVDVYVFFTIKRTLYSFNLLTETVKIEKTFDLPITYISSNANALVMIVNYIQILIIPLQPILSQTDIRVYPYAFNHNESILAAYFAEGDIRFGLNYMNTGFVRCFHKSVLQPLLPNDSVMNTSCTKFAHQGNQHVLPSVSCNKFMHYQTFARYNTLLSMLTTNFYISQDEYTLWELLPTKKCTYYDVVLSQGNSFILYIHPITGLIHFVPDHPEVIKVFKCGTDFLSFICKGCKQGERKSVLLADNV